MGVYLGIDREERKINRPAKSVENGLKAGNIWSFFDPQKIIRCITPVFYLLLGMKKIFFRSAARERIPVSFKWKRSRDALVVVDRADEFNKFRPADANHAGEKNTFMGIDR